MRRLDILRYPDKGVWDGPTRVDHPVVAVGSIEVKLTVTNPKAKYMENRA